jgi:mono/diheme cytochrome c family protein
MEAKKSVIPFLLIMLLTTCLQAQVRHTIKKRGGFSLAKSVARGKLVYTQNCLSCHQDNGGGVPTMNPPLIKTTYVLGDKTKLIGIVLKGFNDDVDINGSTYSNSMPPHDYLKDQEIADVLTYVRNSFSNKASAVTLAEVKKTRTAK